ncbi:Rpn family recombination-promoting nuclease/putative transposase [Alkalispirochaeta sphaeroplastigenens]|nr:Rpn family recombination-promoting nuclease/putative transposase [Alkalispirochaeta sphaeroplastigenens]
MNLTENTNQGSAHVTKETARQAPHTPDRPRRSVPLTSDFVFKYVFGSEHSTEILKSLLSAVQEDAGYPAVATVQITNPFNQKDYAGDKLSVVDVKATDVTGAIYTMEAQANYHEAFSSRALYYWARSYGRQLAESEIYSRLQPVVGVNVMGFRLFPEAAGAPLHTAFRACCPEAPQLVALTDFIIHFIELPRFTGRDVLPSTAFGRWMYYITYRGEEGIMEDPIMKAILEDTSEIRQAEKRYGAFVADAELQDRLEARDKFRRTHLQLLHDAEQKGLKQGIEQGIEQGKAEGKEEGKAEGKAEGKEEGRIEERRETARKLKSRNMPIAEIAEITDLSEEEIRQL